MTRLLPYTCLLLHTFWGALCAEVVPATLFSDLSMDRQVEVRPAGHTVSQADEET